MRKKKVYDAELNFNLAEINISITSKKLSNDIRNRELYNEFITNNKLDARIEERCIMPSNICLNSKNLILDTKYWSLYNENSYKIFILKPTKRNSKITGIFNSDITKGKIYLTADTDDWLETRLGRIIILNLLSLRRRFMSHASGIIDRNKGYLFLGKSGAGKTTMAKLWLERGEKVIHDEHIIVYKKGADFWISGVPWDNKLVNSSPSKRALLKKIFFLKHGKKNRAYKKNTLEAFNLLTKSFFIPGWDKRALGNTARFCLEIAGTIPNYELEFIPDCDCIDFIRKIR